MKFSLRLLYLYLFSAVGLFIIVFGSIGLVNLSLKTFIFTDIDTYEIYPTKTPEGMMTNPEEDKARQKRETSRQRQRQLVESISAIAVGLPLYFYHWKTIQKEKDS